MNYQPDPEFDAIVSGLKHDMSDPIADGMLASIKDAEAALNSNHGHLSLSQKVDVIAALDFELRERGLYGAEIYLSGRIRIAEDIDEELSDLDTPIPELEALGEKYVDESGPFYYVSQYLAVCSDFDVVSVTETLPNGSEQTLHRVFQKFRTTVIDDDDNKNWLYGYPGELDVYNPREPSVEKMILELTTHYPDIVAQLDVLPIGCEDDNQLYRALEDVALTVDWSKYPTLTQDERNMVIEYAVQYITDRLQFDTELYTFKVKGPIYSLSNTRTVLTKILNEVTELRGAIGHIRLVGSRVEDGVVTYLPELELMAPAAHRWGGSNLIYVPLTSITGIQNLRNTQLFDTDTTVEYTTTESVVEPLIVNAEVVNEYDTVQARIAELTALQERFVNLFEACRLAGEKRYKSVAEAQEDINEISEYLTIFKRLWPSEQVVLELAGDGVLYVPLVREYSKDEKDDTLIVRYPQMSLEKAGVFARRGIFKAFSVDLMAAVDEDSSEDTGRIEVRMILDDVETESSIDMAQSESFGYHFYTVHSQRIFIAEMREGATAIALPELEKMHEIERGIDKIGQDFSDLDTLPSYLSRVHRFINQAMRNQHFVVLDDIDIMNEIGQTVGGDEMATKAVTAVMEAMIGNLYVVLEGPMYTEEGKLIETAEVNGIVSEVIATTDQLPVSEPMLRVMTSEGATVYVPIATLERLKA